MLGFRFARYVQLPCLGPVGRDRLKLASSPVERPKMWRELQPGPNFTEALLIQLFQHSWGHQLGITRYNGLAMLKISWVGYNMTLITYNYMVYYGYRTHLLVEPIY